MAKKQKDRHLGVPAEANRDKHVNYVAEESDDIDPGSERIRGALADPDDHKTKKKNKKDEGKNQ